MSTLVLSMFEIMALVLAAVSLMPLASAVREQTHEIGVRMALDATPQRVRDEIVHRVDVMLAGAGVGLVVALASACTILLAVALIAAYLPARHASRVDPARALQVE